jgi:hypothetical protein
MYIAVVNAALASIADDLCDAEAHCALADRSYPVMTNKESSKAEPRSNAKDERQKTNPAFDTWLEGKLHNMFDAVAAEPLPPDLIKLLQKLDEKTKGGEIDLAPTEKKKEG